jgi:hypothetical protein
MAKIRNSALKWVKCHASHICEPGSSEMPPFEWDVNSDVNGVGCPHAKLHPRHDDCDVHCSWLEDADVEEGIVEFEGICSKEEA